MIHEVIKEIRYFERKKRKIYFHLILGRGVGMVFANLSGACVVFSQTCTPAAGTSDPPCPRLTPCGKRKPLADPAGRASMTVLPWHLYLTALGFWMAQQSSSFPLPNATELVCPPGGRAAGLLWGVGVPRSRRKRYLSPRDMSVILDYHNQVRAQVSPPAANMEYMVSRAPAGRFGVRSSWLLRWG